MRLAAPDKRAPSAPPSVVVTLEAPPPLASSDLGIHVTMPAVLPAKHPLVTVGDSLTDGFQSGAVFNTDLSWAVLVARAGGYATSFLRPHYDKFGGLPFNLEYIERLLEEKYGTALSGLKLVAALFYLRGLAADICHYWQDGDGAIVPHTSTINDNLATYGYDLRDALDLAPDNILRTIAGAHENVLFPFVAHGKERAALRTLPYYSPADPTTASLTALDAATGKGLDGGIDTLVVLLGANNVLGVTMDLCLRWSADGYDQLGSKDAFNIWRPEHFSAEFARVARAVSGVNAQHVIFGTVPHVTIVPLLHGIGSKVQHPDGTSSRYFPYYSRPWFDETNFDPTRDPHITENDARTVDSVIDQYNGVIVSTVAAARHGGRDWRVVDLCGILDRLATRRYIEDPAARPSWWTPYPLPPPIDALVPKPDSRFFLSDATGRTAGGLFALDGIHPTTIGYGILAQEVINVMRASGVSGVTDIDFEWLIGQDSLISAPPAGLGGTLNLIRFFDEKFEFVRHLFAPGATTSC